MTTETNYAEHFYDSVDTESDLLRKNTEVHPFSAVARFLLLYHSKKNNEPSFDRLAKQSAIYFSNIPWIQYQLAGINGKAQNHEEIVRSQIKEQLDTADEPVKYETETLGVSDEERIASPQELHENQRAANEQITDISDQPVKYETETLGVSDEEQIASPQELHEKQRAANEQITDISDQPVKYETETLGFSEEEQITFEPLHTVDYFASQGIKISEEALENDHLGQQVKSFTAWLKSMKKLHPGQLPEQNEVIEKIIQSSAEVSNQSANVLTEAMAEVLIKQGKHEKAIEMYEKLSLMNPSKSAYFAAKIESLKTI